MRTITSNQAINSFKRKLTKVPTEQETYSKLRVAHMEEDIYSVLISFNNKDGIIAESLYYMNYVEQDIFVETGPVADGWIDNSKLVCFETIDIKGNITYRWELDEGKVS